MKNSIKQNTMLNIKSFVFNPFQENTYILSNEKGECLIFDPGCYSSAEQNEISKFIKEQNLTPKLLINTHCHIDHVLGNNFIMEKYEIPLWMHKDELPLLHAAPVYGQTYGVQMTPSPEPEKFLDESNPLTFGEYELKIFHVPGHSPGSICFYYKENDLLICGDVLFYESIGRTDLPGGNHAQLLKNIKEKLFKLNDETVVYSGHGPETSIGHEKKHNPFLVG